MKTLDLIQGSPEWCAHRHTKLNASEAPAMMGASEKVKRNELLHIKATGTDREFSDWFQANILDKGHEVEARARPIAEEIIGEELYPVSATDDDGYLAASFDGITMLEDVIWECKQWNEKKAESIRSGDVPEEDIWQVVQQLVISRAEKCLYMVTDGTKEKCEHIWVTLTPEAEKSLDAGWRQFNSDLSEYEPKNYEPEPQAAPVAEFPALFIDISGKVDGTNLATYKHAVTSRIQAISTDLKTDQDFADAEGMVKFLDNAEKEIESVKKQALAKTASIDELFKTVDHLKEEMRTKRLALNKLVQERKKEVKIEIAQTARAKVDEHVKQLNNGLGGQYMPEVITDFNGAMKGKRTVDTLQSAADDEVARAKIQSSEIAEKIRGNLKLIDDAGHDFLFGDRVQLVLKETGDLQTLIAYRIGEHEKAENERLEKEREKIRAEEQEKAQEAAAQEATESTTQQEPVTSEPPSEQTDPVQPAVSDLSSRQNEKRPSDQHIIDTLAMRYNVHESKVVEWLLEMDLEAASEKLVSNM